MSIATKTGDAGTTGLVDGSRVAKASSLIVAIGEVDEANSALGLAVLHAADLAPLQRIQNDLFDLGADLATPGEMEGALRIVAAQVERLKAGNEVIYDGGPGLQLLGEGTERGAFFAPTLLLCRDGAKNDAVHDVEAFGPVSTLMPYDDFDEALALAEENFGPIAAITPFRDAEEVYARANGSEHGLAAYVFTRDPRRMREAVAGIEAGMVGLTGRQTAVYPLPRPGGWPLVGRTNAKLVDVAAGYFPLRVGDKVQFRVLSSEC